MLFFFCVGAMSCQRTGMCVPQVCWGHHVTLHAPVPCRRLKKHGLRVLVERPVSAGKPHCTAHSAFYVLLPRCYAAANAPLSPSTAACSRRSAAGGQSACCWRTHCCRSSAAVRSGLSLPRIQTVALIVQRALPLVCFASRLPLFCFHSAVRLSSAAHSRSAALLPPCCALQASSASLSPSRRSRRGRWTCASLWEVRLF